MSRTRAIAVTMDKSEATLQLHWSLPWVTLLLAGASILIMAIPGATQLLQYENLPMGLDRCWRPFTCHLTHWSANHLFWDVLMFVALGAMTELHNRKSFLFALAVSACVIPLLLTMLMPGLQAYRGLSGIDSALTGLIATTVLCEHRKNTPGSCGRMIAIAAFAGLALKMIYEASTGAAIFVLSTTESPVPLAHLVGVVCGIAAATLTPAWKTFLVKIRHKSPNQNESRVRICL